MFCFIFGIWCSVATQPQQTEAPQQTIFQQEIEKAKKLCDAHSTDYGGQSHRIIYEGWEPCEFIYAELLQQKIKRENHEREQSRIRYLQELERGKPERDFVDEIAKKIAPTLWRPGPLPPPPAQGGGK